MLEQLECLGDQPAVLAAADQPAAIRSWPSMTLASTVRCGASVSSW